MIVLRAGFLEAFPLGSLFLYLDIQRNDTRVLQQFPIVTINMKTMKHNLYSLELFCRNRNICLSAVNLDIMFLLHKEMARWLPDEATSTQETYNNKIAGVHPDLEISTCQPWHQGKRCSFLSNAPYRADTTQHSTPFACHGQ